MCMCVFSVCMCMFRKEACNFTKDSVYLQIMQRTTEAFYKGINKLLARSEAPSDIKHNSLMFQTFYLLWMAFSQHNHKVSKSYSHLSNQGGKHAWKKDSERQMLSIGADEYFTLALSIRAFCKKKGRKRKKLVLKKTNVFAKRKPSFPTTLRVQIISVALQPPSSNLLLLVFSSLSFFFLFLSVNSAVSPL